MIIEEHVWVLLVLCAAVEVRSGQEKGTSQPPGVLTVGFTLSAAVHLITSCSEYGTPQSPGAPIKMVEVTRLLARRATHVEF